MPATLDEVVEEPIIEEFYITGDEDNPMLTDSKSVLRTLVDTITMKGYTSDQILREHDGLTDVKKSIEGSRQESTISRERQAVPLMELKVVEPPYPPEILKIFSQSDETNSRCIAAKSQDAVGRPWTVEIEKTKGTTPDVFDEEDKLDEARLRAAAIEVAEATSFLGNCNNVFKLEGVLLKAAMDLESIGWAAIEVIRSADMKAHSIDYAPAERFKVLEGWRGFVEERQMGTKVYYQPFGEKILSKKRINPNNGKGYPYNAELDGDLTVENAEFHMLDWETGKVTSDFTRSASEIIWIVKHHPSTLYYGITESLPILPKILTNMHINQYSLQFFEHNTVPRYVVIIKGAKLDSTVKDAILKYFQTEVKGRAHKTMIIPLPTGRGEVNVEFKKLDADNQDGWFRESYKDNSNSIRIAHGVTAAIVGQSETASLGSGKGMSQAEIYKDRIVIPSQCKWAGILNDILNRGRGLTLVCVVFAEIDTRDHETKMRVMSGYFDRGIVTINQVRAASGLGAPIKGGNRAFIKVGNAILFVDEMEGMKSTLVNPMEMAKLNQENKAKNKQEFGKQVGGDTSSNKPPMNAPENTAIDTVNRGPNV